MDPLLQASPPIPGDHRERAALSLSLDTAELQGCMCSVGGGGSPRAGWMVLLLVEVSKQAQKDQANCPRARLLRRSQESLDTLCLGGL